MFLLTYKLTDIQPPFQSFNEAFLRLRELWNKETEPTEIILETVWIKNTDTGAVMFYNQIMQKAERENILV